MNRVLTVMFTDIKGFTERTSARSRTDLRKLLATHDALLRPVFTRCGGRIVKTIGDAFMVVFESPTNAVICGMLVQETLRVHNKDIPEADRFLVRVAINTGECEVSRGDVFGETVNIAARIEGITEPGDIWFTESVYLSMQKSEVPSAEIGERMLKGIPQKVRVYKVIAEPPGADRSTRLLSQAREGKLKTQPPDLSSSDRPRLRQMLVPAILLLAILGTGGYLLMISLGGGDPDRPFAAAADTARALVADGKPDAAIAALQESEAELGTHARLDAALADAVQAAARKRAEDGDVAGAMQLLDDWSARPSLAPTLQTARRKLVDQSVTDLIAAVRRTVTTRDMTYGPGQEPAWDECYAGEVGRLMAFYNQHPDPRLEAAMGQLAREEVTRLIRRERFEQAMAVIEQLVSYRSVFDTMLSGAREQLEAAQREHDVQQALAALQDLVAEGNAGEAVDRLTALLAEGNDPRLHDPLLTALQAQVDARILSGEPDAALELLGNASDRVPFLRSRIEALKEQAQTVIRHSETLRRIGSMIESNRLEDSRAAASELILEAPDLQAAKDAYRRALYVERDQLVDKGEWLLAAELLDNAAIAQPWLEPIDPEVRALIVQGAETMEPDGTHYQWVFWNWVRERFHRDTALLYRGAIHRGTNRPTDSVRLFLLVANLPGGPSMLRQDQAVEMILAAAGVVEFDDYEDGLDALLPLLPRERTIERLREYAVQPVDGRIGSFRTLERFDSVTPEVALAYHWQNLMVYDRDQAEEVRMSSIEWLRARGEDGTLEANRETITGWIGDGPITCLQDWDDDRRNASAAFLQEYFLDAVATIALKAMVDEEARTSYRQGCYAVVKGTPVEERADVWAYHRMNIVDIDRVYLYDWLVEAIAWFADQAGTDRQQEALDAVMAGRAAMRQAAEHPQTYQPNVERFEELYNEAIARLKN